MPLYFVQHGVALAKEIDPDRRLSEDGRKDVERISLYLKGIGVTINRFYHSGKTRAMETAQIFAGHIGDGSISELPGMNPDDDVKKFIKILKEDDAMYVGHLPHLEKLISYLITGNEEAGVVKVTNSGVICLNRDTSGFHVEWYLKPSMCRKY